MGTESEVGSMAYGYPYQMQQPVMPSYFNTNYAPPMPQMQQTSAANVTWIYVNGWDGARLRRRRSFSFCRIAFADTLPLGCEGFLTDILVVRFFSYIIV